MIFRREIKYLKERISIPVHAMQVQEVIPYDRKPWRWHGVDLWPVGLVQESLTDLVWVRMCHHSHTAARDVE